MAEKEEELFPKDENGWAEYGVNRGAYDDQLEYLNSVRLMRVAHYLHNVLRKHLLFPGSLL